MEEFNKGLFITVAGMGMVFLSLSLIMLAIWVMERLFRNKEKAPELAIARAVNGNEQEVAVGNGSNGEDEEIAAAIALALAVAAAEEEQSRQGKWLTVASHNGGSSMWTAMGRQILMNSRYITRETKRQ